jgi:hypothetical protein
MRRTTLGLGFLTAALLGGLAAAAGDRTGDLGPGGVETGDVSPAPGEQDRIGINLTVGEPVKVRFGAKFPARLALADAEGEEVPLGFVPGARSLKLNRWPAPSSGRFEFRVMAQPGEAGKYELTAMPDWPKSVEVSGLGPTRFHVAMPAASRLSASFKGSGLVLNQLRAPNGQVLLAGVFGNARRLKIGPIECAAPGVYEVEVTGDADFAGKVMRAVRKVRPTKLELSNGVRD